MRKRMRILIEEGWQRPSAPLDSLGLAWQWTLEDLYREFYLEDGKTPLETIIPFRFGMILRFVGSNGFDIDQRGFKACGMASLTLRSHGSGRDQIGHIEDVFIRPEYRGFGHGETLLGRLIQVTNERELLWLELTSKSKRRAAHALYQKLGFMMVAEANSTQHHATNLFRLPLRTR